MNATPKEAMVVCLDGMEFLVEFEQAPFYGVNVLEVTSAMGFSMQLEEHYLFEAAVVRAPDSKIEGSNPYVS